MALTQVTGPYPIFTDLDGTPLDDGYLYIGAINDDPETNPIQVFWDSNLTIPATQPIRTSNGYAYRNGTPALLYTGGEFSITIRNKRDEFVLYSPVGYGFDPAAVSASVVQNDFTGDGVTVAFVLSASPSTKLATSVFINGVYQEKDSYSISGNTLVFTVAPPLSSSIEVMTNETGVIGSTNATLVSYTAGFAGAILQTVQTKLEQYVSVKDFGATGDGVTDDTAAIQAAILAADSIYFPAGEYLISDTLYMRGPFDGIYWRGKYFMGAGVEATRIKAASGFAANYMIFMGNEDFDGVSNRVYSINNKISDMTLDNFEMADTTSQHGIFTFGTFNNRIQDVQIGVVAFPYTRWDMSVAQGTYTTVIDNVHCQQWQASTALVGDITTIFVNSGSATFVNLSGAADIIFDKFTIQGTYSGGYQQNRVQIDYCANVGFRNGDLEGDGVMFNISNSNGIMIDNNNVAMPGSYTKTAVNYASIFIKAQACVGILAQGNVFMNWLNGPLTPAPGTYLNEPAAANRSMRLLDFNGASFAGARYNRTTAQVIPTTTETIVNFATVDYDIGTFQLVNFASQTYTNTSYVTTGASWQFAAPLRGYYSVKANVLLENLNVATQFAFIAVHVAGSEVARVYNSGGTSSGLTALSIATDVFVNAGAAIQIKVYHTGGGTVQLAAGATFNNVSIALLNVK